MPRKKTDIVQLKLRLRESSRLQIERAAKAQNRTLNAKSSHPTFRLALSSMTPVDTWPRRIPRLQPTPIEHRRLSTRSTDQPPITPPKISKPGPVDLPRR